MCFLAPIGNGRCSAYRKWMCHFKEYLFVSGFLKPTVFSHYLFKIGWIHLKSGGNCFFQLFPLDLASYCEVCKAQLCGKLISCLSVFLARQWLNEAGCDPQKLEIRPFPCSAKMSCNALFINAFHSRGKYGKRNKQGHVILANVFNPPVSCNLASFQKWACIPPLIRGFH